MSREQCHMDTEGLGDSYTHTCSACGCGYESLGIDVFPYCPWCGAEVVPNRYSTRPNGGILYPWRIKGA